MAFKMVTYGNETEWLANRRLGASDCPVIMGTSTYKSAYTLWAELRGLIEREPIDAERARYGHLIEPIVCSEYSRITGQEVIDHGRFTVAHSVSHPWLSATLDREIVAIDMRGNGVLEAKNAGQYNAKEWTETPPLDYWQQVQAQLAVTGYAWGALACLIGGNHFRYAEIERDNDFIVKYLEASKRFWQMVVDGVEPPADGSKSTAETLRHVYTDGDGSTVMLPQASGDWHAEFERAKADLKDAEARKVQASNLIATAIGKASLGVLPQALGSYSFSKSGKSRALRHRS